MYFLLAFMCGKALKMSIYTQTNCIKIGSIKIRHFSLISNLYDQPSSAIPRPTGHRVLRWIDKVSASAARNVASFSARIPEAAVSRQLGRGLLISRQISLRQGNNLWKYNHENFERKLKFSPLSMPLRSRFDDFPSLCVKANPNAIAPWHRDKIKTVPKAAARQIQVNFIQCGAENSPITRVWVRH
jgi:hypothetical protein